MIYHLVGHEILNKAVYSVCHSNVYSSRKWQDVRKIAKNGILKMQIYEANDISSCRA